MNQIKTADLSDPLSVKQNVIIRVSLGAMGCVRYRGGSGLAKE